MKIGIELPDEAVRQLEGQWGDVTSRAREAVVIEGYRSGALSEAQLAELLGLASRVEADALLKRAGVYLDYTEEDLLRAKEASREQRRK